MKRLITKKDIEDFKRRHQSKLNNQSNYAALFGKAKRRSKPDLEALAEATRTGKLPEDKEGKAILEAIKGTIEMANDAKDFRETIADLGPHISVITAKQQPRGAPDLLALLGSCILLGAVIGKALSEAWKECDK